MECHVRTLALNYVSSSSSLWYHHHHDVPMTMIARMRQGGRERNDKGNGPHHRPQKVSFPSPSQSRRLQS